MNAFSQFCRGKTCVLVLAFLVIAGLRTRYSVALTSGQSMAPTLDDGDILLVDNWAFSETLPDRGEVVVAHSRGELLVKRVVGLPGEELFLNNGLLQIDGVTFAEDYTSAEKRLAISAGQLNADRYALVGDNRSLTTDELVHAIAGSADISGRVIWSMRLSSLSLLRVY